jgi:vacuolar-type H+-ATPase subunit H
MNNDIDNLADLVDELATRIPEATTLLKLLISNTDDEFDELLERIFEDAIDHIERNANHLVDDNEEKISAYLSARLSILDILWATQETHCNGHVDITILGRSRSGLRRRLCEAKIYDGPKNHIEGLEQLINRYATGREGLGFIIEYVKKQKIKELVVTMRSYLDQNKPCSQDGESKDHRIRWAFITNHEHSSGDNFRVLHLNCNLFRP